MSNTQIILFHFYKKIYVCQMAALTYVAFALLHRHMPMNIKPPSPYLLFLCVIQKWRHFVVFRRWRGHWTRCWAPRSPSDATILALLLPPRQGCVRRRRRVLCVCRAEYCPSWNVLVWTWAWNKLSHWLMLLFEYSEKDKFNRRIW